MMKMLSNKLKYILKIEISPFEIAAKFVIITCSFFYMLICFSCWGAGYHDDGFGGNALAQNEGICKIEGKTIFYIAEGAYVPFFRLLIKGPAKVYTKGPDGVLRISHIFIENTSGEKVNIITFKNLIDYRWDAKNEISDFVIVESSDYITFYYDMEPIDGFVIESNPFAKNIQFVQTDNLRNFREMENACFYY